MVRAEAAQARLAGADQVVAREAGVVGAVAHRHPRLGGHSTRSRRPGERLAEDLLRGAGGVDVGGVDQVDAGVEAHVDLAARAVDVRGADVGELAAAAEGHRAEGERGDAEAGAAELAVVHAGVLRVEHAHGLPAHPRRDVLDGVAVDHLVGPGRDVAEVGGEQGARRLAQLAGPSAAAPWRRRRARRRRSCPCAAAASSASSSTIGPREVFTSTRRRLHQRQLARADEPARAVAEPRVDRQHVGALEQLVALDARRRPPPPRPRPSGSRSTRSPPSRTRGRSPPSAARGRRARGCPSVRPASSGPIVRCQPPSRMRRSSSRMLRW